MSSCTIAHCFVSFVQRQDTKVSRSSQRWPKQCQVLASGAAGRRVDPPEPAVRLLPPLRLLPGMHRRTPLQRLATTAPPPTLPFNTISDPCEGVLCVVAEDRLDPGQLGGNELRVPSLVPSHLAKYLRRLLHSVMAFSSIKTPSVHTTETCSGVGGGGKCV